MAISNRFQPAPDSPGGSAPAARRSNLLTVVAVAFLAYAMDDMIHEVLGHGTACQLLGVRMLGLSTIGLQTESSSRLVAAAGSIANVLVGCVVAAALERGRGFGVGHYFLWLFAFVNLMNGTGYLMASAATGGGDWAVVIAGREPETIWRVAMGLVGLATFAGSIRWACGVMRRWIAAGEVAREDVARLTVLPYVAGGLLFVAASVFNPVGPAMILASGVAASFGLTFGLLFVTRGDYRGPANSVAPEPLPFSRAWAALGLGAAAVFAGFLGPGLRF